ncbi:MAG: hypothetical protein AAGJ46_10080 [Planctomycetota bacterium]
MLIDYSLTLSAASVLGVICGYLYCSRRSKKQGERVIMSVLSGFVAFMVSGLAAMLLCSRVYVVTEEDSNAYLSMGGVEYEFSDGEVETLRGNTIVNDTSRTLMLEQLSYGEKPNDMNKPLFGDPELEAPVKVEPYSMKEIAQSRIDHLPGDPPPNNVMSKRSRVTRLWLHFAD